ncbi:protein C2-DOMAIN ABA-RELATED 8-like [Hordeum vulgare subsp. vulgare]|uniref:C2 domain-containing protein n=1 Tax=Hordeum vulgare subsp. vulgare TaxID=112509 RepID=A0A8I6XJ52_HORVV|nr:protein C2-DOMAIN ABA-RELATED 8-like [Hordeum vulgare subsp. vulgare]
MASEPVIGKLSVRVVRGHNLIAADPLTQTSDPYVILSYGSQKVKTCVQNKSVNPVWNDVLLLPVTNLTKSVKLEVFDADTFTADDSMGVAEFSVTDIYDAAKLDLKHASDGTRIKTIYPVGTNYLGGESHVSWTNGKVVQDLILKLKDVDSGSVVLQLEWVHVPPSVAI